MSGLGRHGRMSPPMSRQERTEQIDSFLKGFEWNWTKAVLFSLALTFFVFLTAIILPSFWTYYAEQSLGWGGPTDIETGVAAGIDFIKNPTTYLSQIEWTPLHPIQNLESIGNAIPSDLGKQIRDAIAMGITTVFFALPLIVATVLQNKRRKLRGTSDSRPGGGYK